MRKSIRDRRSTKTVKPRIMDYIRDENGEEILEVKDGNIFKTIYLNDFEEQIKELRLQQER